MNQAATIIGCEHFDRELQFFCEDVGMKVAMISPADNPHTAVVSGFGTQIELTTKGGHGPGTVRVRMDDPEQAPHKLRSPGGTLIIFELAAPAIPKAQPFFEMSRPGKDLELTPGRAGMEYRDLLTKRQGGRFVASTITIKDPGPVNDYVHYHLVRYQMIYCRRGWVKVVYEDQGPALRLTPGDFVTQPPGIRHQVLESSGELQVVELGCPAIHPTYTAPGFELPNIGKEPAPAPPAIAERFGGQEFVHHKAAEEEWEPSEFPGFEMAGTAVAGATSDMVGVRTLKATANPAHGVDTTSGSDDSEPVYSPSASELLFVYILAGSAELRRPGGERVPVGADVAMTFTPRKPFELVAPSPGFKVLEVAMPAGS